MHVEVNINDLLNIWMKAENKLVNSFFFAFVQIIKNQWEKQEVGRSIHLQKLYHNEKMDDSRLYMQWDANMDECFVAWDVQYESTGYNWRTPQGEIGE